ncbi:UDP-glycosyltransferase 92A1 [Vitis vinifera]|uniref:UDP-glycosyltransferase 92A1 n=1 Tax=Vitis vinifera TaxID=29760 RepID=A0A438JVN5_VITVI|nr:UDP-glycosyltransferase 92A1 [Vitis vinifera]
MAKMFFPPASSTTSPESNGEEGNIVMFPYMAQGHIIPFLALALEIEKKRGCTITFVTTPLNLKKLQSSIPSNSSIVLLEIPFCSSDHGLPPNTDNTDVLPQSLMSCLDEASLSLKSPFRNLISNLVQHGPPTTLHHCRHFLRVDC